MRLSLVTLLLLTCTFSLARAAGEESGVRFFTVDTAGCDFDGKLDYTLVATAVPKDVQLTVILSAGDYTEGINCGVRDADVAHFCVERSRPGSSYAADPSTGVRYVTLRIVQAWVQYAAGDDNRTPFPIGEPSTRTFRIYGKPTTAPGSAGTVDFSDGRGDNECGARATLTVSDGWQDVSHYTWSSSNADLALTAAGTQATLATADGKPIAQPMSSTVTLRQTVAGIATCYAENSHEVRLLGEPTASLAPTLAQAQSTVLICSSLPEGMDAERDFAGTITTTGVAPFTVTLSTGDTYVIDQPGPFTFDSDEPAAANHRGHANRPGDIHISDVVDAHGCRSTEEAPGAIAVSDRKPHPDLGADSVTLAEPRGLLEISGATPGACVKWGATANAAAFGASIDTEGLQCATTTANVSSTINGSTAFWVVEVDQSAGVDCPSDTTYLHVTWQLPLRYPNAFSPNGDGRNDRLVIEGLPANNIVTVLDERGKKVYEAANYRNDWAAEGLDDGYYTLLFKGDGLKATRETLVIKRTRDE